MKKIIFVAVLSLTFFAAPAITTHAAPPTLQEEITTTKTGLKGSLNLFNPVAEQAGFPKGAVPPEVIIGQLIKSLIVLMGVIFGVLMVYAGFLWMTARGDETQTKKSKAILESATIGIIIVVAAYAITTFVVDKVISSAFQPSAATTTSTPERTPQIIDLPVTDQ